MQVLVVNVTFATISHCYACKELLGLFNGEMGKKYEINSCKIEEVEEGEAIYANAVCGVENCLLPDAFMFYVTGTSQHQVAYTIFICRGCKKRIFEKNGETLIDKGIIERNILVKGYLASGKVWNSRTKVYECVRERQIKSARS